MQQTLEAFLEGVRHRDPHQPEFHQAVTEVMESLWPFIEQNPKYADKKLLERLVEPERIIQFRVSWVDDNGEVLWTTGMGHNDYMYLSDIMPENPGLEVAYIYETPQRKNGVCVADAKTGRILWGLGEQTWHVNDGYAIDLDPALPGMEVMGLDFDGRGPSKERRWLFSGSGRLLNRGASVGPMRRGVYWDADLEKEECTGLIRDFDGGPVGGMFAGNWVTTADLFGDWREELVVSLPGEVRIYTTSIPAMDRRPSLMQEHSYRTGVLNNAQGYPSDACLPCLPTQESDNFSLIRISR